MSPEGMFALEPPTAAQLEEYRSTVATRLAASYERYRHMSPENALSTARYRAGALVDAAAERADTRVLVMQFDGQQIGTVAFSINRNESHLFLWDIFVDAQHRRRGFGVRAMALLERIARSERLERLQLSIEYGNQDSSAFFLRIGYQFVAISAVRYLA